MASFDEVKTTAQELILNQEFDSLAVGVLDFKHSSFDSFVAAPYESYKYPLEKNLYFDLASLTKPLTLGLVYLLNLKQGIFWTQDMLLLLHHKGGLPSGGRLSRKGWKEQILSYPVRSSTTLYSDYSALRLQLEIEKKMDAGLKSLCDPYFQDVYFWKELPANSLSPETGSRYGKKICGEVHDDNAFVINEFCAHAGLFGSVDGVCQTVLKMTADLDLLNVLKQDFIQHPEKDRFRLGWDTVSDTEKTLAGKGAGKMCFGHLGFTGTSIWIDIEKERGHVILTNATQHYWHERAGLNQLRRTLGEMIWNM